jgi:hypothetical protein
MQKRIDQASESIYLEDEPRQMAAMEYQKLCREAKIDIRAEYVRHLEFMNKLNVFKGIRKTWDQAFFKSFVLTQTGEADIKSIE